MFSNVEMRLVGVDGTVRHSEPASFRSAPDVWSALANLAQDSGKDGDVLQVVDREGGILIRIGVSTARAGGARRAPK